MVRSKGFGTGLTKIAPKEEGGIERTDMLAYNLWEIGGPL